MTLQRDGRYRETGRVAHWLSEFESIELQLANSANINWDECEVAFKTYILRREWGGHVIE